MTQTKISTEFLRKISARSTGIPYLSAAMSALEGGDYRLAASLLERAADAEDKCLTKAWDAGQGWKV